MKRILLFLATNLKRLFMSHPPLEKRIAALKRF